MSGSGSSDASSNRRGPEETSLKYRILSRPPHGGTPSLSQQSGTADDSASNTPVPSPSSSHSRTNSDKDRMDTQPPGAVSSLVPSTLQMPAKKRARLGQLTVNNGRTSAANTPSASATQSPCASSRSSSRSGSASETTTPCQSPQTLSASKVPVVTPQMQYQSNQFKQGSLIQLANGELKAIERMTSEDFVQSAALSSKLKVELSGVSRIENNSQSGATLEQNGTGCSASASATKSVVIYFKVGHRNPEVAVEASVDHPFFVLGRGWASVSPLDTLSRFGLHVSTLLAGDTCISLSCKEPQSAVAQQTNCKNEKDGSRIEAPVTGEGSDKSGSGGNNRGQQLYRTATRGFPVGISNGDEPGNQNALTNPPNVALGVGLPTSSNGVMISNAEMASFRRWSAPEDDRFLNTLPPK